MASIFKLPGLGESVETGVVTKIHISKGDSVKVDQNVLEIETGKAILELPTPFAGVVEDVFINEGDEVGVGQDLLSIEESGEKTEKPAEAEERTEAETETPKTEANEQAAEEREKDEDKKKDEKTDLNKSEPVSSKIDMNKKRVPAAPSVRRFAREIGVRIEEVPGSGPHGRVSVDDVKSYARHLNQPHMAQEPGGMSFQDALPPLPNFETWGAVEREKMNNVRLHTARQVTRCWSQIPMVTHFDRADITKLEELRKKYADRAAQDGGKLTMAVMMVKIAASALKIFPQFNASVDMRNKEVIYRKYFNIGIAVSTEKGLFVPVLKSVDQKNMVQIAAEVSQIAQKARDGKLAPQDMEGGCFTVTNLGNIGGTHFTPIVNFPEVAILGMGRAYTSAVYKDGEWQSQVVLPLSLSYDHRLIDGADGARFLKWIAEAVEEPLILSLEG